MKRTRKTVVASLWLLLAVVPDRTTMAAPAPANSAPPPAPDLRRAEAAERFDRGIALIEAGDDAGALAELTRAYELSPHPSVLYNLGLVYASLGRAVDATRALDGVLAAPGTLPSSSLERARRTRDDQARHVAGLDLTTNVPATIEIDGLAVGQTPLASPLAIAAGTRVVTATSPGFLPIRREVAVAGQATATLHLELQPTERRLAHLSIRTPLPDADVLIDGQRIGRTPLPASLAVAPGARVVELRRAGYQPVRRSVSLDDGATGELALDLVPDPASPTRPGRLVVAASEPEPDITVDGQPRGVYREPLRLPPGQHQLRTARAGFLPVERLITVPEGGEAIARVTFIPTPETRAAYERGVQTRRTWGWSGVVGGAVVGAGAVVLLLANRGPLRAARNNVDDVLKDPRCDMNKPDLDACPRLMADADDRYNLHQTMQNVGFIALGVGVLGAAIGTALLLTSDDAHRYDRASHDPDGSVLPPSLAGWIAPGGDGGGFALAGGF